MTVPGWDFTKEQGEQLIKAADDNSGNGLEIKLGGDPIYAAQGSTSPEGIGLLGAAIVLAGHPAPQRRFGRPGRMAVGLGPLGPSEAVVLGERGLPQRRRIVMVLEPLEKLAHALVPKEADDVHECAVAGGLGDAQVKLPVRRQRRASRRQFVLHFAERGLDRVQLRPLRRLRRECRAFGLDHAARAQQLERARERVGGVAGRAVRRRPHVDTRADAHLDQSLHLEGDQRLAHRRPRHPELAREITLGRKAGTGGELPVSDQHADLVGDLPVEAAGLDALEGHGRKRRLRAPRGNRRRLRADRFTGQVV